LPAAQHINPSRISPLGCAQGGPDNPVRSAVAFPATFRGLRTRLGRPMGCTLGMFLRRATKNRSRRWLRTRHRRGSTVVEFAVFGPIVLLLFFGVVELARGLLVVHLLTNASRMGCRAGVIEGTSTATITTVVRQNLTGVGVSGENINVQVND